VAFLSTQFPVDFAYGAYDLILHLEGNLLNGDTLDPVDLTANAQFTLLHQAEIVVDNFDIQPSTVVQGQEGIPAVLELKNTGESAAELTALNLFFLDSLGQNVSGQWVVTGSDTNLPLHIYPGNSLIINDTLSLSSQATLGQISGGIEVVYRDTLKPQNTLTENFPDLDSVVVVRPGQIFIDSTGITGLPNFPFANYNQGLTIWSRIVNPGEEPLQDVKIRLLRNSALLDSVTISMLANDSVWVQFAQLAPASSQNFLYKTEIVEAFSQVTGLPVQIGPPVDNTELIIVESPASLKLTAQPQTAIISQGQQFTLTATVTNEGEASIDSGKLALTLPNGYHASENLIRSFTESNNAVVWHITGDSLSTGPSFDSLIVDFNIIPNDLNLGSTASVQSAYDTAYVAVRVEEGASLLSQIQITSPPGALDSVVSTSQTFVIQNVVDFFGSVADTPRTSQLFFPADSGYSIIGSAIKNLKKYVQRDTTEWQIRGPGLPRKSTEFYVITTSLDSNKHIVITDTSNVIPVVAVEKAALSLEAGISDPPGATDEELSTHQMFRTRLEIVNSGVAGTVDTSRNKVRVELPSGYSFTRYDQNDTLRVYSIKTDSAVFIPIFTDSVAHPELTLIHFILTKAALDSNSNQPAVILKDQEDIQVRTISRAALTVSVQSVPNLSQNQEFTVTGALQNVGDAGIAPSDSVWLVLRYDTAYFQLISPDTLQRVKLFNNQALFTYQVRSKNMLGTSPIQVAIRPDIPPIVYDENNYPDSLVFLEKALDTTLVTVQTTGQIAIESLWISWPAGAAGDTLSTGQLFRLKGKITAFGSVSENGQAELVLPADSGFALQDTSLVKNYIFDSGDSAIVEWTILAPEQLSLENLESGGASLPAIGERREPNSRLSISQIVGEIVRNILSQQNKLEVRASATEVNTLQTLRDTSYHNVTVLERPTLTLNGEITAPPGAVDQTVSTYQNFKLRVGIVRSGEAPTIDTSLVKVKLPDGFSFLPGSADSLITVALFENSDTLLMIYTDTVAHPVPDTIRMWISKLALDKYSGDSAQVDVRTVEFSNMRIIRRAELVIEALYPDTVAQSLNFPVRAVIHKLGDAGVLQQNSQWKDSVLVKIDTSQTGFGLMQSAQRKVALGDTIEWTLTSALEDSSYHFGVSIQEVHLYDENNYPDSIVHIAVPEDTFKIRILNQPAILVDSLFLSSFTNPPTDSLLVSTGQENIHLRLRVSFNPVFSMNRVATLDLPPGVGSTSNLQQPVQNGVVEWQLKAPNTPSIGYLPLTVYIQAVSPVNDSLSSLSQSVYLKVITKANLILNAEIISPDGARDDTVSYGQEFVYKGIVQKTGQAGVVGTGTLKLRADSLLQIKVNDTTWVNESTLPFTVGQPVTWTVKVDSSQEINRILARIVQLQAQKDQTTRSVTLSAEEGGSSPFAAQMSGTDQNLNELYRILQNYLAVSSLSIRIEQRPNDVLTGLPAFASQDSIQTTIVIMEQAEFKILEGTVQIPAKVSTNQVFTIQASVLASDTLQQISNQRFAELEFPGGFGFQVTDPQKSFTGNTVSWQVTAPAQISAPILVDPIRISVWATDNNSGEIVADTVYKNLTLEREAVVGLDLDITDPPSAFDRRLAFNQPFTIRATVKKKGDAGLTGAGKIKLELNQQDSVSVISGNLIQNFTWPDSTVEWQLRTPGKLITTTIKVTFAGVPNDVNTQKPAKLDTANSVASLSISTEAHRLIVAKLDTILPNKINRQGTQNIPVIGMVLNNEKTSDFVPDVLVDSLTVSLRDENGNYVGTPYTILDSITVVNYAYVRNLRKQVTSTPQVYARVALNQNTPDLIPLDFMQTLQLAPGIKDTLIIMVDLSNQAPNKSFRMRIENIRAYVETVDNLVQVVDEEGNIFGPGSDVGVSDTVTVITKDVAKIFGNYPNPFGEREKLTRFVFWMEYSGSAEIRLYTLLGGLVWSKKVNNLNGGQLYDGVITWDGRNNAGQQVLNGVYIAIIEVRYGNGQSRTFKTKVAYIK